MYSIVITNIFELLAAITGTFYIRKYREDLSSRYFVYFLWLTVFVELVFGWLSICIEKIDFFSPLNTTVFVQNDWIYNIYDIVSFALLSFIIIRLYDNTNFKKASTLIAFLFLLFAIVNASFSNEFYEGIVSLNFIFGSILLLLLVILYFFQLLMSDKILDFYKMMTFYISVGILVYHLTTTPIFIYWKYFSVSVSPKFVEIRQIFITIANIFVYTCYTLGFWICLKKNKSY
ncbi:hypothetical protein [Aquimarina litoralis]|uniref:hypothetical protein n=1 Tax=Aquimarina litoralis TaxID=584605 RepID=UPI001C592A38|nr:hypothetical protein [Aquimarina litoralis]MBW1297372.1 hypothetical protein [Aquimarina litoralis]